MPFGFENIWLQHHDFKRMIRNSWVTHNGDGGPIFRFMGKLMKVKEEIKKWNVEVFGQLGKKKMDIIRELKNLDEMEANNNWSDYHKQMRKDKNSELNHTLMLENKTTRQKMKVQWLKEGDENSKFFHRTLSARRNKAMIKKLKMEDNSFTKDEDTIVNNIVGYFYDLYAKDSNQQCELHGI
ncbi:hypothetical protein Scep_019421 [Stephania cephalantha]|uniref:RNA-directed DNA polymerase, eukaryota, reverse transcriptase zinc-binding domain protein n=1 Tax=Stephania cephalantha TaxID=152367 RepID=A0AAP0IBA0_9MAGN